MSYEEEIQKRRALEKNRRDDKGSRGSKGSVAGIKSAGASLTAFTEIDPLKDAVLIWIVILSIIADILSAAPFVGGAISLVFTVLLFILLKIGGYLKISPFKKIVINGGGYGGEIILGFLGLGIVPFFTMTAIANYWMILKERKEEKKESID
ncbi:MAG: hypothetical protein U5L10_00205 [Candidatus Moranbacteria bacterium]|nr:hypothetical protein [Candidatus Moranbacteria bacterium]